MSPGTIIFLNGTSSAGKSSIARAFQDLVDTPYMHLAVDQFCFAVPFLYWVGAELGQINAHFATIVTGFHHCIATLATTGNNVIVDHVLQEPTWWHECLRLLASLPTVFVRVHCSLPELERREAARGDRPLGLARFQYLRVYTTTIADVTVDTETDTPEICATTIWSFIGSGQQPSAFQRLLTNAQIP